MATPALLVSRDAQQALQEFSTEFDAALSLTEPLTMWSRMFGLVKASRAIKTTFPIPISAAGYKLRSGDSKMRRLYEKSTSVTPVEWEDGFVEKAQIVEAPDFIGWGAEPGRIAAEGARQPNVIAATLLAANTFAGPVLEWEPSALNLFASTHPVNIFDGSIVDAFAGSATFDNTLDWTTGAGKSGVIDAAMLKAAKTQMRRRPGPNGRPLGVQFSDLLVPAGREQEARDALENDLLIQVFGSNTAAAAGNNRMKGSVKLTVADELTSDNYVYAIDGAKGCYPWVIVDGGSPEQITFDKTDSLYKTQGLIGMKFVLLMQAAGALPHGITRIKLA